MKNNAKVLLIISAILCMFCSIFTLSAESALAENDIIYSILGGKGEPSYRIHDTANPELLKSEGLINLSSPIQERQLLGYRQLTLSEEEEANSSKVSLQFEYVYNKMFSLKVGMSRFKAVFDNVSAIDYKKHLLQLDGYSTSECGSPLLHSWCRDSKVNPEVELYTIQQTWYDFKPVYTLDLGFDFHIPTGPSLDPYIGVSVGHTLTGGKILKADAHLGIRNFFESGIFIGTELYVHDYLRSDATKIVQDRGVNISMGFRRR